MLFQVTAIILLLVFYGCYFGKMFLQKRQGIQTDQIGKGKTGTAKVIETLMKITTILVPLVESDHAALWCANQGRFYCGSGGYCICNFRCDDEE